MKRIVVITLSNLGDAILTTPVMARLRDAYPAAKISVVAGDRAASLFNGHPWFEGVFVYDKTARLGEKIALMQMLRRKRFDLAVDLRHSLIPLIIGAKRRNPIFRIRRAKDRNVHAVEDHLNVLKELGLTGSGPAMPFPFYTKEIAKSLRTRANENGLDVTQPYVLMAPGARSHIKRWPAARYGALASAVEKAYRYPVVLVGDVCEMPIAAEVLKNAKANIVNFCGRLTIQESAALIDWAALIVTNDSATLHLADQQRRPVVSIFGPTNAGRYGPFGAERVIVRKQLFCSPCEKAQCAYGHECMNELTVEEIGDACRTLLAKRETVTA